MELLKNIMEPEKITELLKKEEKVFVLRSQSK